MFTGKNDNGFTLIELVVVMAIIAILATLMVAAIVAARNQSRSTQRVGNVKTIEVALEARKSYCGAYYGNGNRGGSDPKCNVTYWGNSLYTDAGSNTSLVAEGWLSRKLTIKAGDLGYAKMATSTNYTITACSAETTAIDTASMVAGTPSDSSNSPCTDGSVLHSVAR